MDKMVRNMIADLAKSASMDDSDYCVQHYLEQSHSLGYLKGLLDAKEICELKALSPFHAVMLIDQKIKVIKWNVNYAGKK